MSRQNFQFFLSDKNTITEPVSDCVFVVSEIPETEPVYDRQVYIALHTQALEQEILTSAVSAGASGIVLAGVRNGTDIQLADVMLSVAEATEGLPQGHLKIFALPGDNPEGLLDIRSMSGKSQRLSALGWNRKALAFACGHASSGERLTGFERCVRSMVLLAAAACGVAAIDTPDDERDPERFRRLCEDARAEGFCGKVALYQEQLPIIRQVFGE